MRHAELEQRQRESKPSILTASTTPYSGGRDIGRRRRRLTVASGDCRLPLAQSFERRRHGLVDHSGQRLQRLEGRVDGGGHVGRRQVQAVGHAGQIGDEPFA